MSTQNGVKPLADLFTVVIGLSLTIALQSFIDVKTSIPFRLEILPALIAFLVTVLPFAHGAITHLLTTYGDTKKTLASASLIVDYIILFVNGCIFIGWASLLPNTKFATYSYMCILIVDAVWGFLVRIFSKQDSRATPTIKWAIINAILFVVLALLALAFIGPVYQAGWDEHISWGIAVLAIVRTTIDYSLTYDFYIGKAH